MSNLRLLQIIDATNIAGSFENLLLKLKCIRWHYCPWTYLPSTFRPQNLISLYMPSSKFKRLWKGPMPIKQLSCLSCLYLNGCRDLKRLPEQLGDMKALKKIDASYTAIEKLPDSITHLKELVLLNLRYCKKLRKLPEQLGKMLCLEEPYASKTTIEEVPDSIGLLSRLQLLILSGHKLKCVPESIWNLTSIVHLVLRPGDVGIISLPDSVKNMKGIKFLWMSCNVRLWLPIIQCFSSLEWLTLVDVGQILSLAKPFSLSKLFNLQYLRLDNCTSLGSSLPELPLNLRELRVYNHNSLEQLPDLSSLKQLKSLQIWKCINLQSILLLPYHLQSLVVKECTSLQDVPDLSMLKELGELSFTRCNNLKSISLKPSCLQGGQSHFLFTADLPNREVAEWFNYKSSGHTVSFDIPPNFGSNFLGLALWVVYTCKARRYMRAVITNETEGITKNYFIYVETVVGEAQSKVECITGEKLSMKSGDRIQVEVKVPVGEVKVKMCGVHVIQSI